MDMHVVKATVSRTAAAALASLVLLSSNSVAQHPTSELVSWSPSPPANGSALLLTVRRMVDTSDAIKGVTGSLADQELHFERSDGGNFVALGAIPIEAGDTLELSLTVNWSAGEQQRLVVLIPSKRVNFGADTLSVATRFTEEPDSALAERIERERELARGVTPIAHRTERIWSGRFMRPLSTEITSGFGRARVMNGEVQSRHLAVDLDGEGGEPVFATGGGLVALVRNFYYSGNVVFINHGAGLITAYSHLSRAAVVEGQNVTRGQIIGRVGSTGRVTGPHLHWTARYGTVPIDPLSLLHPELTAALP